MSDEREVEIPWAVAHARGPCLDVGCAESTYLADLPGPVDGIDTRNCSIDPPLRCFFQGDIRTAVLPERYRTVLAISTIEHIGLAHGNYGTVADDPDGGDRAALEGCVRAAELGGQVLMSVPWGDAATFGWYRRYDDAGLRALLKGFCWSATYRTNPEWPVGGVALVTILCA